MKTFTFTQTPEEIQALLNEVPDKLSELSQEIGEVSNEIIISNEKLKGTIAELYLIAPKNSGTFLAIKPYNNELFVRYGKREDSSGIILEVDTDCWQCRMSMSNMKNNEIITLYCTTASPSLGVSVGDIVGYIIFKDIDTFRAITYTIVGYSAYDNKCRDVRFSPIIQSSFLPKEIIAETLAITLPKTIDVVIGDTMQMYWRSLISAVNPYNYDIYAVCSVGKSYPRYYELTPTDDMIGKQYALTLYVKGNNGAILAQQATTIVVHNTAPSPTSSTNVLCVGASATASGIWSGELRRRLTATDGNGTPSNPTGLGLSNINFVGRKVGTSVNVNLEATGGWRVQDYTSKGRQAVRFYVSGVDTISLGARYSCNGTIYVVQEANVTEGAGNIRCTLENTFVAPSDKLTKTSGSGDEEIVFSSYEDENFSPFWNVDESRIDFKQYADTYCDGHIDCLIWHCGVNDITSGDIAIVPNVINAFRNLLDAYHSDFPNGKVIISSVPIGAVNGGFGANYGASASLNYYTFAKIAQYYAKTLYDLCNETQYADYVIYSAALEEFDAENNYPSTSTPTNTRSSIKENLGTNAVHPIAEGSYQIADAIYRTFNSLVFESSEPEQIEPYDIMEGVYLAKGGGIAKTTSPRAVATYPIIAGKKYKLYVPKTGNAYASIYAFTNIEKVVVGTSCKEPIGEGNEQSATLSFTAPAYQYVYVCYTTTGGAPTLTRL